MLFILRIIQLVLRWPLHEERLFLAIIKKILLRLAICVLLLRLLVRAFAAVEGHRIHRFVIALVGHQILVNLFQLCLGVYI